MRFPLWHRRKRDAVTDRPGVRPYTGRIKIGKGGITMSKNVGGVDRILRIVVGLALLGGFFLNADSAYRWLYLVGIVPLATGLINFCPLYRIFGISTCKLNK